MRHITMVLISMFAVMIPTADAGDEVEILVENGRKVFETNKKENTKRIKEREKTKRELDKQAKKLEEARLKEAAKVERERVKLEGKRFRYLEALENARTDRQIARAEARLKAIEAALEANERRRVQLGIAKDGDLAGVSVGASDDTTEQVVTAKEATAKLELSERQLEMLRKAHVPGTKYTEDEARLVGYIVYSNGALAKLERVEVGGTTYYVVVAEHIGN